MKRPDWPQWIILFLAVGLPALIIVTMPWWSTWLGAHD